MTKTFNIPGDMTRRKYGKEVAFTLTYELDTDHTWDGDGDEPDGPAYLVTITAMRIVNGALITAEHYFGGVYFHESPRMTPAGVLNDLEGNLEDIMAEAYGELLERLSGVAGA